MFKGLKKIKYTRVARVPDLTQRWRYLFQNITVLDSLCFKFEDSTFSICLEPLIVNVYHRSIMGPSLPTRDKRINQINGLKGCPTPKKVKTIPSADKNMVSVFWNARGIIFIDYLEKGNQG